MCKLGTIKSQDCQQDQISIFVCQRTHFVKPSNQSPPVYYTYYWFFCSFSAGFLDDSANVQSCLTERTACAFRGVQVRTRAPVFWAGLHSTRTQQLNTRQDASPSVFILINQLFIYKSENSCLLQSAVVVMVVITELECVSEFQII